MSSWTNENISGNESKFYLNIMWGNRQVKTLLTEVSATTTIYEVKQIICDEQGGEVGNLHLRTSGRPILHDNQTLKDYGIQNERNYLMIVFKAPGGEIMVDQMISKDCVLDVYSTLIKNKKNDKKTEEECLEIINSNSMIVLNSKYFLNIPPKLMLLLIKSDAFEVGEDILFNRFIEWYKLNQHISNEYNIIHFLPYFRYPIMNASFLASNVFPYLFNMSQFDCNHFNHNNRYFMPKGSKFIVTESNTELEKAQLLSDSFKSAQWSRKKINEVQVQYFIFDIGNEDKIIKFFIRNYYGDPDTIKDCQLQVLINNQWQIVMNFTSLQVTTLQIFNNVNNNLKGRYWKFIIKNIYGNDDRYTCLDRFQIVCEQNKNQVANKYQSFYVQ